MHQVSFIEGMPIESLISRLAHKYLRSLGYPSEKLVGRMRRKNHRFLWLRSVRADRMHVLVEMMESSMRQPGFVEMQCADLTIEHATKLFNVVDNSVVSTLSDRQDPRLAIWMLGLCFFGKRICVDLALDAFERKLLFRDWTDNPQIVTSRGQENWNSSGHDNRV